MGEGPNKTYEIKRKNKLLEKEIEEKEFFEKEKLRDMRRLKRRKELERQMKNKFLSRV